MDNLLKIEPGLIIWTFITFTALLLILKKVAWKPLLDSLASREERIHSDLQRTEHAREEAEKLLAEHKKLMQAAELDARRVTDEARQSAEKLKADLLAQANEQAAQVTAQARAEIQREKDTALAQLRTEIADLAIAAAAKILKENLDEARNRKLVDEFISDLPRKN
jgi:F-type H+-transporting ATPase subunit b